METNCLKHFNCTGVKTVDVTVRARVDELVMVDMGTLNDIYQQGFFSVCTMEAEDA